MTTMSAELPLTTHRQFGKKLNRQRVGYYFVLPALLIYAVFFLYPFLNSVYLSFTDWNGVGSPVFTGLNNYIRMIQDPVMWRAVSNNLVWIVLGTIAPIAIGLLIAVLLWSHTRGQLIFRTIYFMPVIMSPVIVGVIWGWIYNPVMGILNKSLNAVGLEALARGWLGEPSTALLAVLAAAVWGYTGFCVAVLFAGLQKIDQELIDASKIDGANAWERFIYIIIPQLRHILTMISVYTIIGGFNVFDIIFTMTGGGPANATEVIATYAYKKSFVENEVGYGSALSTMMTLLALVATIVFMYVRESNEERS